MGLCVQATWWCGDLIMFVVAAAAAAAVDVQAIRCRGWFALLCSLCFY
jgi:hypothetical protein